MLDAFYNWFFIFWNIIPIKLQFLAKCIRFFFSFIWLIQHLKVINIFSKFNEFWNSVVRLYVKWINFKKNWFDLRKVIWTKNSQSLYVKFDTWFILVIFQNALSICLNNRIMLIVNWNNFKYLLNDFVAHNGMILILNITWKSSLIISEIWNLRIVPI